MLTNNAEVKDSSELEKFFRAFELTTEFRAIKGSDKSLLHHLPRLIKGGLEYQFLPYYFASAPRWRMMARKLSGQPRMVPNYVMTGPGKSGSSDLVSHLLLHPNVMPPLVKEPRIYADKNWQLCYPTLKEKQEFEARIGGAAKCGYLEPSMHTLKVIDTIHQVNPDCKIIITLRDPVARAYSYWKWEVFIGGKHLKQDRKRAYFDTFASYVDRAIDLFPSIKMDTVTGPQVLDTGIYYKAVETWIEHFGRDNVMVMDVAEYFNQRQPVFEKIQKFLDIPVVNIPESSKKANENPIKLPPADAQTKAKLGAFYRPYNQTLFNIIGKEFNWL